MAFAVAADISTRLMRTLSAEESAASTALIAAVQSEIETLVGRTEANLSGALLAKLKHITVEAVCRELASPMGAESTSETMGAYSYRVSYRETGGTFLTDIEKLLSQKIVHGTNSGSVMVGSWFQEAEDA